MAAAAPANATAPAGGAQNAAAPAGRGQSCSLYVGDLPTDLANPEDTLFNLFSKIGMVMSIKVCRDINTQRSLGYAYVNFQNSTDAESAMQRLNFHEIRPSRPIRVMWSIRDPAVRKTGSGNIFVKNLDPSIDNRTLHDTFAVFGTIFSCKIATDDDGKSLGYGFVHFETDEAAKEAISRCDGMAIGGKEVTVIPFIKKSDRDEEEEKVFTSIYVKNLKGDTTEENLKALLAPYASVESVFIGDAPNGKYVTKFALVALGSHEGAVKAIESLHEKASDLCEGENKLYVARALKKRERAAARSRTSANNLYQSQGRNVYVKHLDDTMNQEEFEQLFKQFGEITSVKLMSDTEGQMRGFGFVCYANKESAAAAIRDMNGKMIGRRPLYVSQAQQKDMRHHMLDEQRKAMMQQQQRMAMNLGPQFWDGGRGGGFGMRGGFGGRGGMPPMAGMPGPGGMPFGMMPPMRGGRGMGGGRGGFQQPGFGGPHMGGPRQPFTAQQGQGQGQPMPPQRPSSIGISSQELSKLSPEEQKNALGEKLYVKIQEVNPHQAPKITGMLLEMDIPEILNVLEDRNMLVVKVQEAVSVLQRHDKH